MSTTTTTSSIGSAGGRDYATITAWEAATDEDLEALEAVYVGELYNDSAFPGTSQVFNAAGTSRAHYRVLRAATGQRHAGVEGTGARLVAGGAGTGLWQIEETHLRLEGIAFDGADLGAFEIRIGDVAATLSIEGVQLTGLLLHDLAKVGSANPLVISAYGLSGTAQVQGCTVFDVGDFASAGAAGVVTLGNAAARVNVVNCTFYRIDGTAVLRTGWTTAMAAVNVLARSSTTADFAGTFATGSDFNLSGDATAPGTNSKKSVALGDVAFVSTVAGAEDLHVTAAGQSFRAGHPAQGVWLTPEATDIDGAAFSGPASIGADDVPQAAVVTSSVGSAAGRDYATLAAWEAATDNDLVAQARIEVGVPYKDSAFAENLVVSGAVTSALYYRQLVPVGSEGHVGTEGTGVVIRKATGILCQIAEANFVLSGLELDGQGTSGVGVDVTTAGANAQVARCLVHDTAARGVQVAAGTTGWKVQNTVVYEVNAAVEGIHGGSSANGRVSSCTVWGGAATTHGIRAVATAENCVAGNTATADFADVAAQTTNASEDATATGLPNLSAASMAFVSAAPGSEDFHLQAHSALVAAGTDRSAVYDGDLDGFAPRGTAWDIGADQQANPDDLPASGGQNLPGGLVAPFTTLRAALRALDDQFGDQDQFFVGTNRSGATRAAGEVGVLDATDAAGDGVTTTATAGDAKVLGVFAATVLAGGRARVQVTGKVAALKVNDSNGAIAVGDPLETSTTAGVARRSTTAGPAFAVALAAWAGPGAATVAARLLPADHRATALPAGNTLDGSYDQGGAGAGRTVTVDAGAVALDDRQTSGTGLAVTTAGAVTLAGDHRMVDIDADTNVTPGANAATGLRVRAAATKKAVEVLAGETHLLVTFAQVAVEAITATDTLAAAESRKVVTNEGATGAASGRAVTLPAAAAGLVFEVYCQDADLVRVVAGPGDTISIGGTVSKVAGYVEATAVGDALRLAAVNATEWVALAVVGSWNVERI